MIKLGLISAASYGAAGAARASGSHHGTAFSTTFNGFDEAKAKECQGTFIRSGKRLEGARVVRIWDPLRDDPRFQKLISDGEASMATQGKP